MATSYRPLMRRLLYALRQRGKVYSVTNIQAYSKKTGRMCTKYLVSAQVDGQFVRAYQCWNQGDLVKWLAEQYKALTHPHLQLVEPNTEEQP